MTYEEAVAVLREAAPNGWAEGRGRYLESSAAVKAFPFWEATFRYVGDTGYETDGEIPPQQLGEAVTTILNAALAAEPSQRGDDGE